MYMYDVFYYKIETKIWEHRYVLNAAVLAYLASLWKIIKEKLERTWDVYESRIIIDCTDVISFSWGLVDYYWHKLFVSGMYLIPLNHVLKIEEL